MRQDYESLQRWFADNGDYTHNLNYDLNKDSVIIDLGAYRGLWIDEILKKTNSEIPTILLVEPVPEFQEFLIHKYKDYENIKVINSGVSTDSNITTKILYVSNDGSSTNFKNSSHTIEITTLPIEKILQDNNINLVDLLQINIEGDEYGLMEHMINTGIIKKFKNIQIQFHLGIENEVERRKTIQKNLMSLGFKNKFEYSFVWESWEQIIF